MEAAKAFKPNDPVHVSWLVELFKLKDDFKKTKEVLETNPMNLPLKGVDLPIIHMGVASKYAESVLSGQAYVPEPPPM